MSKFQAIENYQPQKNYKLLPFKFDRFNSEKYILTNVNGEYHLLPSEKLHKLINHSLNINDY